MRHIEVREKPGIFDAVGEGVKKDIFDFGIKSVRKVSFIQVYSIEGDLSEIEIRRICEELLVDKISQEYFIIEPRTTSPEPRIIKNKFVIEVAYNPGVMDPAEDSVKKAILDLGINGVSSLHTAKKYVIYGRLSNLQIKTICDKLLVNKVIQHAVTSVSKEAAGSDSGYKFQLVSVDLLNASDKKLQKISRDGQLFLNIAEMRVIKKYFSCLKRNPTDVELETLAQTWSEHCVHKTFRGKIEYKAKNQKSKIKIKKINNLLKSTIMKATKELNKSWCVSVFSDNSGVIEFDKEYDVCFKVETHNHPSALEPFGGANTGIGGVIRDPLGTGLGAKPIFNTDIFCFGPPDYPVSKLPKGSLHPKRIAKGVVSGVRDYGNKMGIPTINGAVLFSEGYVANPLVYCGTAGLIPKGKALKKVNSGDLIVVVGGRTGRDGIHGATFSSGELTHESENVSGSAVQIGNPITEKKMMDALLKARDRNLYNSITDCGAGGLSSAVGEMGKDLGVVVYLDKVPLKYSGLRYDEIWISEAQERMVLAVNRKNIDELLDIFISENAEATVIGEFGPAQLRHSGGQSKMLRLFYQDNLVGELEMDFLHEGVPLSTKKAISQKPNLKEPHLAEKKDLAGILKKIISDYNVASKEWVVRQYDHEVQGLSVLKPLVGINNDGPSDAGIVRPIYSSKKGLAVSCGINPRYGELSAYWMAASAIDEALRNIVSVGGNLERTAILDNFCWGNPDKPDRLGTLVDAALACYDFAKYFGVPFISGKDSLYNEYNVKGKSIAIPGTLLISAISVMEDATKAVSMDLKRPGNLIYIVGETKNELGGSFYYKLYDYLGANVPQVDRKNAKETMQLLSRAIAEGLVRSAHDCSEGGLAVSLAEMCFAGGFGAEVFLKEVPQVSSVKCQMLRNDTILFSESNTRFAVEIEKKNQKVFEKVMQGVPLGLIGCVSGGKMLNIYGLNREICVRADISELKEAWQAPLRW